MIERTPIFLFLAGGVGLLWAAYFLIAALINGLHLDHSGGDIGGYNLKGVGIFIFVAGASAILGLVFSLLSLYRREKYRGLAFFSMCIYFLPGIAGLWAIFVGGPALLHTP